MLRTLTHTDLKQVKIKTKKLTLATQQQPWLSRKWCRGGDSNPHTQKGKGF